MAKAIYKRNKQTGAVSLFIVLFTALLITIVTVSFIQIMLRGQQEATAVDLSQSAYDSAIGGVEDAKQALVLAAGGNAAIGTILDSSKCNSVKHALGDPDTDSERMIRQDVGDSSLQQAYTCVKVNRSTSSIEGSLLDTRPTAMIPLLSGGVTFNKVKISWKLHDNTSPITFPSVPVARPTALPQASKWGITSPALIRAQLVQYNGSFTVDQLNSDPSGTSSPITRTKFLYPKAVGLTTASFAAPTDAAPTAIKCDPALIYNCQVTLDLIAPNTPGYQAFLQLAGLYNQADYTVELYNDVTLVNFKDVQADVDSTGRAGDVFRRVKARVDLKLNGSFPYPQAAIDLDGNLCKSFRITDQPADYDTGSSTCKPWA
jgi:hypothetical protein